MRTMCTCKYTASRPHINGGVIELGAKEDIRGTVPQSHHLSRVATNGNPKRPGQAKVSQFKLSILKDKMQSVKSYSKTIHNDF